MLMRLEDARAHGIQVGLDANQRMNFPRLPECGSKTGPAKLSPTLELEFSGTGGGTRPGIQTWTRSSGVLLFLLYLNQYHHLLFKRDLDAEGVKVTAYVTAHLNVEGDVYAEAAAVSSHFFVFLPTNYFPIQEDNWLKFENGSQVERLFISMTILLISSFNKTTVTSRLLQWTLWKSQRTVTASTPLGFGQFLPKQISCLTLS